MTRRAKFLIGNFLLSTFQGSLTFVYLVFCECSLKTQNAVHWDDVTIIREEEEGTTDEVVFTETSSPTESMMNRTVSVDVPRSFRKSTSSNTNNRDATKR